jgi:hypothetical protein
LWITHRHLPTVPLPVDHWIELEVTEQYKDTHYDPAKDESEYHPNNTLALAGLVLATVRHEHYLLHIEVDEQIDNCADEYPYRPEQEKGGVASCCCGQKKDQRQCGNSADKS